MKRKANMLIAIVVVAGVIVLAVAGIARSASFRRSYANEYGASRRVSRVTSADDARRSARELCDMVNGMRGGQDLIPFYDRLSELAAAGTFGQRITAQQVENAKAHPQNLQSIIQTLVQIAS